MRRLFLGLVYTHANKMRPSQFTGFVENKYRHDHVMIINLYILSPIFYDRHLWAFCACLKEAWVVRHPRLVECIATVQPASFPIREMWRLGRDTIMYPPDQIIQGVVDWLLFRTRKASQGVWHDQLSNSSLPYCRYVAIVLREEKIVSNSLTDWQDTWVKAFIHIACAWPTIYYAN